MKTYLAKFLPGVNSVKVSLFLFVLFVFFLGGGGGISLTLGDLSYFTLTSLGS